MNYNNKKIVLAIFDGLGTAVKSEFNAFTQAKTPYLDQFFSNNFKLDLVASGTEVGLLPNTMGNSEVGHLTIGAGRVVEQPLSRISNEIKNGIFSKNEILNTFLNNVQQGNKRLHIMGLASNGKVHSDIAHLYALCKVLAKQKIRVYLHLFLDGRDTKKNAAAEEIRKFESFLNQKNNQNITIATISGRFFSMDRDLHFERTGQVLSVITQIGCEKAKKFSVASDFILDNYKNGVFDEFIKPTFSEKYSIKSALQTEDNLICFNFRPDRVIQICSLLTNQKYISKEWTNEVIVNLLCFVHYADSVKGKVLYPQININNTIGEVISNYGLKQLRVAESEKMAHVTYFIDGGSRKKLSKCDKILIPSNRSVSTYDYCPQMSAEKITDNVINELANYDFIVLNYANADMVGHTGNFIATKRAIEFLDSQINRIFKAVQKVNGILIITADHGNAEKMKYSDRSICKTHTKNKVPLCIIGSEKYTRINCEKTPSLQDIASTILYLLDINIPSEMSGSVLIKQT